MIVLTRLNGTDRFGINPDLVERIHASPDTTLVMVNGMRHIVAESLDEVITLVVEFRARVLTYAHRLADAGDAAGSFTGPATGTEARAESGREPAHLSIVHPHDVLPGPAGQRPRK
ncbi:flagellar FlbD family protein [Arthrobacter zhaoguopingii]|uniref:flagellar FlbD family protein n=1 Tax=Arthrobacter zhaoguopingii TaxID=2681491 RepID=UPI00135AB84A|nr:flagellar FlbD family protein [Arthrobacter zhaoguopingii]